jgi:hypothetical protein
VPFIEYFQGGGGGGQNGVAPNHSGFTRGHSKNHEKPKKCAIYQI